MLHRRVFARLGVALLLVFPLAAAKRPLTHADYDGWRHIQNQQLSNDGRYLAYALFPQEGNGELVVRNLTTGAEVRQPLGELPQPPPPNFTNPQPEDAPPLSVGVAIKFSADSQTLVFTSFPPHDDVEKAKREKRKPEEMPVGDLVIIHLASGAVSHVPRVKAFQMPTETSGFVAYSQLRAPAAPAATPAANEDGEDQARGRGAASSGARRFQKGDLFLRDLKDDTDRKFPNVMEYFISRDGKLLVFAQEDAQSESNGVYAVHPGDAAAPVALLSGKGRYNELSWDEYQTRLAFLSDRGNDGGGAGGSGFQLYSWPRSAAAATLHKTALQSGWIISDHTPLSLSKDGRRIFFGVAPAPPPKPAADDTPADEKVSVDLWSWKDDYIQPMQKVRANVERNRSYRAVFDTTTNRFLQLADLSMNEIAPSDDGVFAIGTDNRQYRRMQEYETAYEDSYLVNTATGERRLLLSKHRGHFNWSADSRHAVVFDGKNWLLVSAAAGAPVNLTANLGVTFGREEFDAPDLPPAYGLAGWSQDGKSVLLYDRFDIWRCDAAGASCANITQGLGRKDRLVFRLARIERDDPNERWLDLSQPLLLRADNDDTHDTGFFRLSLTGSSAPQKLVLQPRNFTPPIKARNADVYVTTASTFREYPDLLVTDGSFREFRKVSDANPQLADLSWGSAELVPFESSDGTHLNAILYKPDNFDPSKKYPMLVYIYERLTQGLNSFIEPRPMHSINISYYVSNGYMVLEPDIAYHVGYPGQSALNCVLPAIQAVVARGGVNDRAIGIQGHSWGGYQIAYMVTRTNRFHAAAAGAPVANMISAYDGIRWGPGIPRQFQYEHTQSRIGGTPWEYPMRFIENSPIFMADRINTPLLLLHNDADDAVPWYQGIEYYLALRRLNKEAYLFSYNGEPHGLRRRPNQKDYTVRLQQFFDYQLKDAPKPAWMEHGIPYIEKASAIPTDGEQR